MIFAKPMKSISPCVYRQRHVSTQRLFMKNLMSQIQPASAAARLLLTLLVLALGGGALAPRAFAQANPPERLTYQGYLVDANGTALATNAPKNYDVVFRIHDSSSGTGIALWTEQQTVTVDKGYFSVLLGEGASIGEARPNLSTLFTNATASERWVSLTVKKIGPAQSDVNILPRLRLLTSPYSFLATTAVNAVNAANAANAVNAVNVTGSGTIQASNLGANSVDSSKILDATIVNADVSASAAIADTKLATIATAGKVADTALSTNVALRGSPNTFSGQLTIKTTNDTNPTLISTFDSRHAVIGTTSEGLAFSYSSTRGEAIVSAVAPSVAWKRLVLQADSVTLSVTPFNTNSPALTVHGSGNVGIGTATPTRGKLEVKGSISSSYAGFGTFTGNDISAFIATPTAKNVSIYADNMVAASGFLSFSDARIKNILRRSDSESDLGMLLGIEITDYLHKDGIARGRTPQKKVIAQQVEKVYPQAVSQSTDVVPDIYKKATQKDGWVQLATDLKKGERVRLLSEKTEGIHEVLEVTKDKFRTDFKPEGGQVFVYGREVKDFRSVDYEAISMLNVSATQELARKVKAQESELTELRAELAKLRSERKTLAHSVSALQARDEAREARLIKLELSLQVAPAGDKARTQARAQSPAASGQLTSLNQ